MNPCAHATPLSGPLVESSDQGLSSQAAALGSAQLPRAVALWLRRRRVTEGGIAGDRTRDLTAVSHKSLRSYHSAIPAICADSGAACAYGFVQHPRPGPGHPSRPRPGTDPARFRRARRGQGPVQPPPSCRALRGPARPRPRAVAASRPMSESPGALAGSATRPGRAAESTAPADSDSDRRRAGRAG